MYIDDGQIELVQNNYTNDETFETWLKDSVLIKLQLDERLLLSKDGCISWS
jgi:hypothetical protein